MPGFVKEPVKFRILKPVRGVPRSAYTTGVYETRDRKMIAMLSRLPSDHVQRIPEGVAAEAVPEPVSEPEPEEIGLYPTAEEIKKLGWHQLRKIGLARGVYEIHSTAKRVDLEAALLGKPVQVA